MNMNKNKFALVVLSLSALFLSGCHHQDVKQVTKVDATPAKVAKQDLAKPVIASSKSAKPVEAKKENPLKQKAMSALAEAESINKQAQDMGFDWNVTFDLLEASAKDIESGDFKASIEKSKLARSYAYTGFAQAQEAKTAGPRYIK